MPTTLTTTTKITKKTCFDDDDGDDEENDEDNNNDVWRLSNYHDDRDENDMVVHSWKMLRRLTRKGVKARSYRADPIGPMSDHIDRI